MKKQFSVIVKCLNCAFEACLSSISIIYVIFIFISHSSLERFGCLNNWIEDKIRIRICVVHIIICFQRNVNKFFNLFHRPHDDDDIVFLIVCDQHASCLFVNINIKQRLSLALNVIISLFLPVFQQLIEVLTISMRAQRSTAVQFS